MPWVVAVEIARVLRIGGFALIATHFSIGVHERPWHFFQFSDMGMRVLFSPALGFECIGAGMDNPMVGRLSRLAHPSLRYQRVPGLYFGSLILVRKVRDVPDFRWEHADISEIVGGTTYPAPGQPQRP
jgi:hypothetical protein